MNSFSFCTLFLSAAAVFCDLRTGKIPNRLLSAGLAAALILQLTEHAFYGLPLLLSGALVPFALLYPAYKLGMTGAGDVKLLTVLGSFLSARGALRLLFVSFLCGALIAVVRMTVSGSFTARFRAFAAYIRETAQSGHFVSYRQYAAAESLVHFSVPVLTAVILLIIGRRI